MKQKLFTILSRFRNKIKDRNQSFYLVAPENSSIWKALKNYDNKKNKTT